jgi:hypothetical protein
MLDPFDQYADLLNFVPVNTTAVGDELDISASESNISFSSGQNFYKAGPDGQFDLRFDFPTTDRDGGIYRFSAGESLVVDLFLGTDPSDPEFGLSPLNFDFYSKPGEEEDDKGPFQTAAHVQAIGPSSGSGWIAPGSETSPVPEPATMLLVGMGLIGLAGFGRRRFKA